MKRKHLFYAGLLLIILGSCVWIATTKLSGNSPILVQVVVQAVTVLRTGHYTFWFGTSLLSLVVGLALILVVVVVGPVATFANLVLETIGHLLKMIGHFTYAKLLTRNVMLRWIMRHSLEAAVRSRWLAVNLREGAANELGKLGSKRSIKTLTDILKDKSVNPYVRLATAKALGNIAQIGGLVTLLEDRDEGSSIRRLAAEALGQSGSPQAIEPLVKALLEEKTRYMLWGVVESLDALGWEPTPDEIGAVYWVTKGQWDKCVEIGEAAVGPLLEVFKDTNLFNSLAAINTLGQIGGVQATEALMTGLRNDTSFNLEERLACCSSLEQISSITIPENDIQQLVVSVAAEIRPLYTRTRIVEEGKWIYYMLPYTMDDVAISEFEKTGEHEEPDPDIPRVREWLAVVPKTLRKQVLEEASIGDFEF